MLRSNPCVATLNKLWLEKNRALRKLPPKKQSDIPKLPKDFSKFNDIIGPPLHPETLEPSPILDYQLDYNHAWRTKHKVILNKSRKIGATETGLRTIAQGCYDIYRGHNVMIVAGNGIDHAYAFMEKLDNLFYGPNDKGWTDLNGKVWKYGDLVEKSKGSRLDLYSGVSIKAYAGVPNALRSQENVKCVFISEAAHINRTDDIGVYTAIRPIAINDPNVDFILESTPKGKRGFFYNIWESDPTYTKLRLPYTVAIDRLISRKVIEEERQNPLIDFRQEYECEFTSSLSAAFDEKSIVYEPMPVTDYSDIL